MSKYALFTLSLLFLGTLSFGQMIEDPTKWKYEVKKVTDNEYQLVFHVDIKKGWHIWSLQPGGDGYLIPPTFTWDKSNAWALIGDPTEKGKKTTTQMDGTEGKVSFFSGSADFVQRVKVTGKTKVTGRLKYQACDDKMCLPPKEKSFTFDIK